MSDFRQKAMNLANGYALASDPRTRPAKVNPAPGDIKDQMGAADLHMVIDNDKAKIWDKAGNVHPVRFDSSEHDVFGAHTQGVNGPGYEVAGGDTVPGLYVCGQVIPSVEGVDSGAIFRAYGRYAIELLEQQGQESALGRAGIMMHGGGSAAPDPLAPYQGWYPTHGCIRLQNLVLEYAIVPLLHTLKEAGARLWVSVK